MNKPSNFIKARLFVATISAAMLCTVDYVKAEDPGTPPEAVSASGVGGYNYALPSLKEGSRLLFQGDSITDMKWGRRESDRNHYLGHSYVKAKTDRFINSPVCWAVHLTTV